MKKKPRQPKFVLWWTLVLLLLLSGCRDAAVAETRQVRVLTLSAQQGLSENAKAGLERFTEKVSQLSEGQMSISVEPSDDVLASLDGGCDLIFAPNAQIARADGNFASFTSPFFFYNYKHLSLTLNSQSFLDLTGDSMLSLLAALPIGAFYDGNSALVSARGVTLDTLDQYQGIKIYIEGDEMLEYVLEKLGADVLIRPTDERIESFNSSRDVAIECDTLALDMLELPANNKTFTVCESFHQSRINWMLLSEKSRETLSDWQKAVLTEAVAYAIAENDGLVLEQEQKCREHVKQAGGTLLAHNYNEFWGEVDEILRSAPRYGAIWDWEIHDQLRRLAVQTS